MSLIFDLTTGELKPPVYTDEDKLRIKKERSDRDNILKKDKRIYKSILFSCKIKRILGIIHDKKVYVFHCNAEDSDRITNNLFLYKCLNSKALRNTFYVYIGELGIYINNKKEKFVSKMEFENIDYETEFKNYKIIKIEIPRPDNNINITFKTFKLLFSNVLELKDYSRICLIKNLNLKYYFKKLFDTETTTEKVIEGLTNNITKYLNRKEDELLSKDKVDLTLLTFYNSMISLNSKYKITNTYLYGTKVKEFIKLNNNLKSNLISIENMQLIYNDNKELIENYINSITNLLKVYYIEIFNSIRSIKSRNPESLKLDLNKNINFYFEQCRREVKYSFNDENLLEIVTLVKTTSVIDDYFCIFDSRIKYRDFNKEYFVTDETVYVDLFKIKLFNSDIRSVIVYLYTLDKEMNIYYNIMDTIESNILKIKHLSP